MDYCLRYFYLYLKDVYICKYEHKVGIILGAVQLLMLTNWGCHIICGVYMHVCVYVGVCVRVFVCVQEIDRSLITVDLSVDLCH